MKYLAAIVALAFMVSIARCQELPTAPSSTPAYLQGDTQMHSKTAAFSVPGDKTRHPKLLLALVGAVAFEQAAAIYDARKTEQGLKAGVAVEANTWLVGTHPTFGRLEAKDFLQLGIATSPSVLAYMFHHEGLFLAGLVGPTVLGVKHIQAGRQWQALLDGQPPTESERY